MQKVKIEAFKIIGIAVRTINHEETALQDIGQLWNQFMTEGIAEKIPNKLGTEVFSIYTNYKSDHTEAYDTILGCKVSTLDNIPKGMVGQSFNGGQYGKFVAKGDLTQGVIYNKWTEIWGQELNREYTADFEIYGAKAQNPKDAEVDVLVALKE